VAHAIARLKSRRSDVRYRHYGCGSPGGSVAQKAALEFGQPNWRVLVPASKNPLFLRAWTPHHDKQNSAWRIAKRVCLMSGDVRKRRGRDLLHSRVFAQKNGGSSARIAACVSGRTADNCRERCGLARSLPWDGEGVFSLLNKFWNSGVLQPIHSESDLRVAPHTLRVAMPRCHSRTAMDAKVRPSVVCQIAKDRGGTEGAPSM
jgi:hypothetical protein